MAKCFLIFYELIVDPLKPLVREHLCAVKPDQYV